MAVDKCYNWFFDAVRASIEHYNWNCDELGDIHIVDKVSDEEVNMGHICNRYNGWGPEFSLMGMATARCLGPYKNHTVYSKILRKEICKITGMEEFRKSLRLMKYNTRIAPSPTGSIHLGTLRTAYFNWLLARATGGQFYLRIDDTHQERSEDKYVDEIFDAMNYLGLNWDYTFKQSSRKDRYNEVAQMLIERGLTSGDGNLLRLNYKLDLSSWRDNIVGDIKITNEDHQYIDGLVVRRSDGNYTYHFVTVVDDHDFDINYIVRGQDHVSNTSRQIAIYKALGWEVPQYAHVGLISQNGKKMSKRSGEFSFDAHKHIHPEALLNCMLRLGWSPTKDDQSNTLINREKALSMFLHGGNMRASSANFDVAKLKFYQKKYS